MHCAYVARTVISVSWTRYRTFGMIYSGNMETFDGVMTVTLINCDRVQYPSVLVLKITNNLHEHFDSRGSHDGSFVSQQLYDIRNGTIQLGFVGELGTKCQENVECTNAGRGQRAISDICKQEREEDERRSILGGSRTG